MSNMQNDIHAGHQPPTCRSRQSLLTGLKRFFGRNPQMNSVVHAACKAHELCSRCNLHVLLSLIGT